MGLNARPVGMSLEGDGAWGKSHLNFSAKQELFIGDAVRLSSVTADVKKASMGGIEAQEVVLFARAVSCYDDPFVL